MATIYNVICPVCGQKFDEMRGVLVCECGKPEPWGRSEKVPFRCPGCGWECPIDRAVNSGYVDTFVMAD